jgi:GAF domain-containing protein
MEAGVPGRIHRFFLSETAPIAPSSADVARALQRLARSFVPALADFCLIHLVERHYVRCVAGAHATREGQRLVSTLARTGSRISRHDPISSVAHVVRHGRGQVRSDVILDPDLHGSRRSDVVRRLAPRSAVVVPLVVRDQVLGALTLCYSASGRRYSTRHIAPAKRIARLVVARLTNTPSLLPRRLPPLRARA